MTTAFSPVSGNAYAIGACQPASADLCQNELLSLTPPCKAVHWLDAGTPVILLPEPFATSAPNISAAKPIFLRHMFPADLWLPPDTLANADILADALAPLITKPVALQIRRVAVDRNSELPFAGTAALAEALSKKGILLPEQKQQAPFDSNVLSGVITPEGGIFGVSKVSDNISPHAGGMRHFTPEETAHLISRAEHKLSEAIEAFSLELPKGGEALDLGAAPGGWSKVLLSHGMRVTAVDPASLAPELSGKVAHFAGLAQDFAKTELSKQAPARFSVIVNDMRLDVAESAQVMVSLAPLVMEGGLVIMTFKLPQKGKTAAIKKGMAIMEQAYARQNARQLFHNRSEITAVFTKK
jgi:23S rRNA (cytidine2498-2'-O)-methyltransferase